MQDLPPIEDRAFARFRDEGDSKALTEVFDHVAPSLFAFARTTIADVHLAEDLMQQTFLVAIESRSDWDCERTLLPWLMGILANRARNLRRSVARRSHEELDSGEMVAPTGATDPSQTAVDREFASAFQDAIDELPEPYGPVVDMHLRHGLTAAEIARSLRRPAGTVRTQIVRGCRLLRSSLPQGFAAAGVMFAMTDTALAAAREAIVAHARSVGAIASPSTTAGVIGSALTAIIMNKTYLTIAALLVAALSLTIAQPSWLLEPVSTPEPPPTIAAAGDASSGTAGDVQAAPVVRVAANPDAPRDQKDASRLIARVLQEWDDEPARLVRVTIRDAADRTTELSTADDGTVECADVGEGSTVALPDFGIIKSIGAADGRRGVLEIRVPARLDTEVQVVDSAGTPVPGAKLFSHRGLGVDVRKLNLGTADVEGTVRLRTSQGFLSVYAQAPGCLPSASRLLLAKRPPRGVTKLKLGDPARRCRVTVTNPDGKPAAEALVQAFLPARPRTRPLVARTTSDGIAVFDLPDERLMLFAASGQGRSANFAMLDQPASRGTDSIRVQLAPAASVTGRALDSAGRAVVGANVAGVWNAPGIRKAFTRFWRSTAVTADDGSFQIHGLVPGATDLELTIVGSQTASDVELQAGEMGVWNPIVPEAKVWRLGLVGPQGAPLAGWMVELESRDSGFGSPSGITDEQGVVTFEGLDGSPVRVVANAPMQGVGVQGAFDPVVAGRWDRVIVGVPRKLVMSGRGMPTAQLRATVIGRDGMPAAGARVRVLRRQGEQSVVIKLTTDKAGQFCYGPTVPGSLTMGVVVDGDNVLRPDLELGPGVVLDLGRVYAGATASLAVQLLFQLQQPTVELRFGAGKEAMPLKRDAEGHWRARQPMPAGDYVIVVRERGVVVRERALTLDAGKDIEIEMR